MQAYLNFFDKLDLLISKANQTSKLILALNICRKLYPDYLRFASKYNKPGAETLLNAIEFCNNYSQTGHLEESRLNEFVTEIEHITPEADNLSDWEVSYAYNAVASVSELLMYIKRPDDKRISDICSFMIDTIDFKIAKDNEHLSDDAIFKHPVMLNAMEEILNQL